MSLIARYSVRAILPRTVSRRAATFRIASTSVLRSQFNTVQRARSFSAMSASPMAAAASPIVKQNIRPEPDQVLQDIADYVLNYEITSPLAVRAHLSPLLSNRNWEKKG